MNHRKGPRGTGSHFRLPVVPTKVQTHQWDPYYMFQDQSLSDCSGTKDTEKSGRRTNQGKIKSIDTVMDKRRWHVYMCIYMCTHTHIYICMYIYMYTYIYMYVCVCNGILLNHKKEWNSAIAETWIDLETVIQSEISQKEKSKHFIISLICGI